MYAVTFEAIGRAKSTSPNIKIIIYTNMYKINFEACSLIKWHHVTNALFQWWQGKTVA